MYLLHVTTTELYGITAMVVAMLCIIAYTAYTAGALNTETDTTEENTHGEP